jgi:tetratricopeptide (TPR) repeat protein
MPLASGGETNALRNPTNPVIRQIEHRPQDLATQLERSGRIREAAALYEEMVRTNTTARNVLSHRLVAIYTETGETNMALAWAHKVMRDNPDPQAYLAGVYGRLGQHDKARVILESEIAVNTNATRSITLRWQLAEICDKVGNNKKALKILDEAVIAAKGTRMEPAAKRRFETLSRKAN